MTLNGDYGHFTRMLINVDLSKPLSNSLMLDAGEDCLFTSLDYENLLAFCSSCCFIGHVALAYRHARNPIPRRKPMIRAGRKLSLHEFRMFTGPRTILMKLRKMFWRLRMSQGRLSL